jgi:hypothetical protein
MQTRLPEGFQDVSKRTNKPLPPDLQKAVNLARATNDLIDQALAALEPFKNDNTERGSLNLAKNYRRGIYDPIESVAAQLGDLAGIQAQASSALTAGSSRALQVYQARRQHVPRLPSSRQVEFYSTLGIPAHTVGTFSRFAHEEGGFDSPSLMYHKLLQVKRNNDNYIREAFNVDVAEPGPGIRPVPSHAPTTQPGGAAAPGGGVVFDPVSKKYVFRE